MKFLQRAARQFAAPSTRSITVLVFSLLGILMAASARADGELVAIHFERPQNVGLIASLGVGVFSVFFGLFYLRGAVMGAPTGTEKMQEVALAIRQGALAYLKQQIRTMSFFVVLLAVGLAALNWSGGAPLALGIAAAFVAGVATSYSSGYAGMLTAISGNVRTAFAAKSGPRKPLVIAFRSGAVAGTVTVGLGLIGASFILLAFPKIATALLIGFGFGASLAALFMRVGGGIFTKAADVGADLVGKVEKSIPEDDPRNPAVIADNVGDNVGDCAGMAADVFESYEVTLVAAIVLGAATASIFDPETWPRLIVFALDACAIGLLASMVATMMVAGGDDPKKDQLGYLNRGFWTAASLSFVLTGVLAFLTLGGTGSKVETTQLKAVAAYQTEKIVALKAIQEKLAKEQHKEPYQITADDVLKDPAAIALHYDAKKDAQTVSAMLSTEADQIPKAPDLSGLVKVTDFNDLSLPALSYSIRGTPDPSSPAGTPAFETLAAFFGGKSADDQYEVAEIHEVAHLPAQPAQGKMPARQAVDQDENRWIGPIKKGDLDKQLKMAADQITKQKLNVKLDVVKTLPTAFYTSKDGRIALGVEGEVEHPEQLSLQGTSPSFFKADPATMTSLMQNQSPTSVPQMPPQGTIDIALVTHTTAPWYLFWLILGFGILMSFAIQFLTDYYVGTEKGPTREVANVANMGAAPMIIQGFAHAATSSVFTVLAIVVALVCPLIAFSPTVYGGYTLGYYGVALVGIGMLTTTAFILAMDTFGPISDNAQGVFEMSGEADADADAAHVLTKLDAVGNTTKALTKGYAIATAVVAAVALFHAYLEDAHLTTVGLRLDVPEIFLGLLIGGAAPYLFASFSIHAVGRAAVELITEVRRQFADDSGIMAGTSKPNYAKCVAIVTAAAQRELLAPGILAIALPIAVGFGFSIGKPTTEINGHIYNLTGAQALGGFLAGAIVSSQLLAVLLANSGGMWDNAKKLIEDGLHGGKGSEAHKAAIVGDTVGDPFKDTAGPAMNPLIKVMNLVALLISGVVIEPYAPWVAVVVVVVCLVALVGSFVMANKNTMASALGETAAPVLEKTATPVVEAPAATPGPAKRKLFVEDDDPQG